MDGWESHVDILPFPAPDGETHLIEVMTVPHDDVIKPLSQSGRGKAAIGAS